MFSWFTDNLLVAPTYPSSVCYPSPLSLFPLFEMHHPLHHRSPVYKGTILKSCSLCIACGPLLHRLNPRSSTGLAP